MLKDIKRESDRTTLFCYEREHSKLLQQALTKECRRYALVIGSEGGFSEQEQQLLVDAGAVCVSLGQRILRAETAPLYALSVMDCLLAEDVD